MCIFYVQTKKKALLLMPVWQRTDSWGRLYYTFLVPNDTINHFGLWEHCVGTLSATGACAPSLVLLTLLTAQPLPLPTTNTSLAFPFHVVARPPHLYLGADLVMFFKELFF